MSETVLRVVQMTIEPSRIAEWRAAMRSIADVSAGETRGLISITVGVHSEGVETSGVLASVWSSIEELIAVIGDRWEDAVLPGSIAGMCTRVTVRHFENVGHWPGPASPPDDQ